MFLVSQMVTESSAPYLLSGYNTLSTEEKGRVNIKGLVSFWQKFHKILALFILVFGSTAYFILDEDLSILGSIVAILLAYGWSIGKSTSFYPPLSASKKHVTLFVQFVMLGLSLFITFSYLNDIKESHIIWHKESIEFTGYKGMKIPYSDITEVSLISEPLEILSKIEGLGTSRAQKGTFNVKNYGWVNLIITHKKTPYLLLRYGKNKKLIYGSTQEDFTKLKNKIDSQVESLR